MLIRLRSVLGSKIPIWVLKQASDNFRALLSMSRPPNKKAPLAYGGQPDGEAYESGYFVEPTIFTDADSYISTILYHVC